MAGLTLPKTNNAARSEPRYKLSVDPQLLVKHFRALSDFALHAETDNPLDMVFVMQPGTLRFTGQIMLIHPGHSKIVADFFKNIAKDD